jgi:hypothetical protein
MNDGPVTRHEAADLASTSRQLVQDWAVREDIGIAASRAYLLKMWHSQSLQERGKTTERKEQIQVTV